MPVGAKPAAPNVVVSRVMSAPLMPSSSTIAAGAHPTTREGLSRALDALNERMQPGDVDALFRLLDTDNSGVLTKDELGLRGEAAEAVAHYHGPSRQR